MTQQPKHLERTLSELDALTGHTRAIGRSRSTGFPLIGWGTAWAVGYPALEVLDGATRVVVVTAVWVLAILLSWLPMRAEVRTGAEGRLRWAWVAVFAASPLLVTAARPDTWTNVALLLAALWSLAMSLYAIATRDTPYAITALFGIAAAAFSATQEVVGPLLLCGVLAGLPLLAIGVLRVLGARHR